MSFFLHHTFYMMHFLKYPGFLLQNMFAGEVIIEQDVFEWQESKTPWQNRNLIGEKNLCP